MDSFVQDFDWFRFSHRQLYTVVWNSVSLRCTTRMTTLIPEVVTPVRNITVGTKVRIEKGCKARDVAKNSTATVKKITEMGPEFGYSVAVSLQFRNSFLAGKTLVFYARHINRLDDDIVNLNDGRPEHKIQIRKV